VGNEKPHATPEQIARWRAGFQARGGITGPARPRDSVYREFPDGREYAVPPLAKPYHGGPRPVPVLRVDPPAAFASLGEASALTGRSKGEISKAVRSGGRLCGSAWRPCPPAVLLAMRPDLFCVAGANQGKAACDGNDDDISKATAAGTVGAA